MQLLRNLADGRGVYAFINLAIVFVVMLIVVLRACAYERDEAKDEQGE